MIAFTDQEKALLQEMIVAGKRSMEEMVEYSEKSNYPAANEDYREQLKRLEELGEKINGKPEPQPHVYTIIYHLEVSTPPDQDPGPLQEAVATWMDESAGSTRECGFDLERHNSLGMWPA